MNSGFAGRYKDGALETHLVGSADALTLSQNKVTSIAIGLISEPLHLHFVENEKITGPAAIMVDAYLRWGNDFAKHIIGQYCGVVIDQRVGQVLLVQDSFGLFPLFYAYCNSQEDLIFSTSLSDISKTQKSIHLDLEYFADYLANAGCYTEKTPFHGICRLSGGACARWRNGRLKLFYPWGPSDAANPEKVDSLEMDTQLIGLLNDSMSVLQKVPGPLWCDVSGGLDSTTVFEVARRSGVAVEPFSIVSRDGMDEGDTEVLKKIFSDRSLAWHCIDVSDAAPFSTLPEISGDEPGGEIGYAIRHAAFTMRQKYNVTNLLSGMGGDQVFGSSDYMPTYLADYLYLFSFRQLYKELRHWQRLYSEPRPLLFWFFQYSFKPLLMHLRRNRMTNDSTPWSRPYWISDDFSRKYNLEDRWKHLNYPRHSEPGRNALWQELYLICAIEASSRSYSFSPNYYYPLLYRPLVEFMFALPYIERRRADIDRVIQRRALKEILPPIVLRRVNKGTGQPIFDSSFREATEWHYRLKNNPRLVELGIFDLKAWNTTIDRAKFGLYESLPDFCASVCCEIWLQSQSIV